MATYPARAVVLQRTKLGETDLILTMLSESGELIRAVAKGARKPKAKLGAASGLFRCNDWLLYSGRNLDIVTESRTVEPHTHLSSDYRAALGANVIGEFVSKTHLPGQCDPRVYEMTMVALGQLDLLAQSSEGDCHLAGEVLDGRVDALVLAYLIKSLAIHGYRPSADSCSECGLTMSAEVESVEWSPLVAGVLCENCAPSSVDARRIPAAAASWVTYLLHSTLAEIGSAALPMKAIDDLFELVVGLLDAHVQTRLKALEVYRSERAAVASRIGGSATDSGATMR